MIHPSAPTAPRPFLGIALMIAAMTVVPAMDGLAKHLSARLPVSEIVWARYFFHFALLLPVVLSRYGARSFLPQRLALHVLRGGFLLGSTVFFFAAIAVMPLADALALVFISPLVVTALSPWLLGESVGVRRWSAVSVGFAGACIIIRPGFGAIQPGTLLALGAGVVYAFYFLTTRKLSGTAPPLVILAFTGLVGAVAMSILAPFQWVTPLPLEWAMMAAMGAVAASGHFLLIKALEVSQASLLAPFSYSEIVMTTLVGYFAFGDFPDGWTWLGIAVVIASGVYISLRERKTRQP